ncbi:MULTISPECIES: Uma2 family endonuclease [unclassified Roseitalea]|uniref:Uma2 family endonuclease n=1 Tax=unclassified Roseitalea TaxID=2639107 RepID=UPI00273EBB27|nr:MULTISPECIES: Uma2 family endonuclease [unclassified Roseitalea]
MNLQFRHPTNADEFLRWNHEREGRREFVQGKVVEMMINVTERHYWLAVRLQRQIVDQIGLDEYIVGSSDFGVRAGNSVRYPDVMVHRPSQAAGLATAEPLLVAEILSPASMRDDFGPKADEYLAIASLKHYLVIAQDTPRIWLWARDDEGRFGDPVICDDPKTPVELDGLGIGLDLAALYRGIADVTS